MASGVAIAADVKDEFMKMKLNKNKKEKSKNCPKTMVFSLSDDMKEIVILKDECMEMDSDESAKCKDDQDKACFDKMAENLKSDQPRYIVYDCHFTSKDGRDIEKLVFISWCSDNNCPIKKKMVHASSEEYLKKILDGVQGTTLQCHDKGDFDYEEMKKIAQTRD